MSFQKLIKFTKNLDVLIVTAPQLSVPFTETSEIIFRSVRHMSLDRLAACNDHFHLMIVCLDLPSLQTPDILKGLSGYRRMETVVFSPQSTDSRILKTALLLRALNAVALPETEESFVHEMLKIIPHVIKKNSEWVSEGYGRTIAEHSREMYAVAKNGKIVHVNQSLKEGFGIHSHSDIEELFNRNGIHDMMKPGDYVQRVTSDILPSSSNCLVSAYPINDTDTLISIIPLKLSLQKSDSALLNRMNFIEVLKDAYLIYGNENEPIPVIMIHIENSRKIIDSYGENLYNDLSKELITLARNYFSPQAQFAQWNKDVYTVFASGTPITGLKEAIEQLHRDVATHLPFNDAALVLDSFVIDMKEVDLNKAIGIIDHIHEKQLMAREIANLVHFEVSAQHETLDEKDQVLHYLEKLILNKSPIKLLNFYKGIRISTPARLIKLSDGLIYNSIEKLQGYAMKLEHTTVIQADSIPFDLQASVKLVDINKKIAVLSQFQPLKASANNRQHIRIQSDHRMHVTMTSMKSIASGTILDISIKSIACKITNAKTVPLIDSSIVLQFQLPMEHAENGMVNMVINGKVQFVQKMDDYTKVVVILDLEEPYEGYLVEYIYKRQQALINEIKLVANKL